MLPIYLLLSPSVQADRAAAGSLVSSAEENKIPRPPSQRPLDHPEALLRSPAGKNILISETMLDDQHDQRPLGGL
jgi:hypothetical protein